MQSELKLVKEFRRKRAQMQRELDEVLYVNISRSPTVVKFNNHLSLVHIGTI